MVKILSLKGKVLVPTPSSVVSTRSHKEADSSPPVPVIN